MASDAEARGYHRLADLMGHYPEAAIFRRFGSLNMLNLLSLQAELVDLQVQFRDLWAEDDSSSDMNEKDYSTYFRKLRNSENSLQHEMLQEIRKLLREYNAALLQVAQIAGLPTPEEPDIEFLRDWLNGVGEGESFLRNSGSEAFTWSLPRHSPKAEHKFLQNDFVTMHIATAREQDPFSKILSSSLLSIWTSLRSVFNGANSSASSNRLQEKFHKSIDPESNVLYYSEESLLRFNNILISVISAALPVVAIVGLYFIESEGGRIGATAGFTVLFALALATFTNARRLEIAASTAAFAAVEVVFIGSHLGTVQES